jgi:hypothetical protein
MEPWMWAIVGAVPVVAVGAAYAMGAFKTDIPGIDAQIAEAQAFDGDPQTTYGGRRKKTKKSKASHKKTKRRH